MHTNSWLVLLWLLRFYFGVCTQHRSESFSVGNPEWITLESLKYQPFLLDSTGSTRIALRELLTEPKGSRAESITISIPSVPVEVRVNSTNAFLYLGNGVTYTPERGIQLLDKATKDFTIAEEQLQTELNRSKYKVQKEPFCSVVVHEKVFPRRFLRIKLLRPMNPNGVDMDIAANLHELSIYLENYMQYLDLLESDLKQWYYHTSIVFRSIADSALKTGEASGYVSLVKPISREIYPPLNGETLVWFDIARITVFCGLDGLQVFWSMIRDVHTDVNAVNKPFNRKKDPRWETLFELCCVSSMAALNRVLFRRLYASITDSIPGIVSMFRVEGSTIENARPPTLEQIALADD